MASEWYYSKKGQRFGPVSGQQLKQLAAEGELGPEDLVWKEAMKQWVPAKSIKGLCDIPPKTTSAPVVATTAPSPPSTEAASSQATPSSLFPVLIAQTVIASFAILYSLWGIIDYLGFYGLGDLEGIFVCVSIGWNIAILVTTWLGFKQRNYWFSLLAARLMFGSWLFFLFTGSVYTDIFTVLPSGWTILGIMLSVPVGIWSINTLRKPEVATYFGKQSTPENFSQTLLGFTLGNKWENLDQRKKAITAGGCAGSLLLLIVLGMWIMAPRQPQAARGGAGRPKTLQEATDERNKNLGDVTAKRNKGLDDVVGKRNQNLDDIIAKRNAKIGPSPTPLESDTSGGSDDQANRDRIESNLQGMGLNALMGKYGQPDSTWTNPTRSNVRLYIWHLGGSSTDMYVVQLVIHAIDGRSPDIQENAKVLTSSQLTRLKQNLASATK